MPGRRIWTMKHRCNGWHVPTLINPIRLARIEISFSNGYDLAPYSREGNGARCAERSRRTASNMKCEPHHPHQAAPSLLNPGNNSTSPQLAGTYQIVCLRVSKGCGSQVGTEYVYLRELVGAEVHDLHPFRSQAFYDRQRVVLPNTRCGATAVRRGTFERRTCKYEQSGLRRQSTRRTSKPPVACRYTNPNVR